MGEAPASWTPPVATVATPRASTSVLVTREGEEGVEALLCHRVETLRAFPGFWALPGGGVNARDAKAAAMLGPRFSSISPGQRPAAAALLREVAEEVGWTIGEDGFDEVTQEQRRSILEDGGEWLAGVKGGEFACNPSGLSHIATRTTPPFAPLRFENIFWHLQAPPGSPDPTLLDHRSEFDELRWMRPADALASWTRFEMAIAPPIVTLLRDFEAALDSTRSGDAGGASEDIESAIARIAATPGIGSHRIEFAPGVECVPLPTVTLPPATHTNCYILGEVGGERLLVDPAARSPEALAILEERLLEVAADGGRIIATIYTHRHPDHIGDLTRIAEMLTAPIWTTVETQEAIPDCDSDRVLEGGECLTLQGPSGEVVWQVISTPGHCPGHIALAGEAGVVSGDVVTVVGTILVPSGEGDMTAYLDDLETLRSLRPRMLFPSHGPYTAQADELLQRYIRHRSDRHAKVLDAVRTGLSILEEIAARAYEDTPDADQTLARDQTLSHLRAHEAMGDLQLIDGRWWPGVE